MSRGQRLGERVEVESVERPTEGAWQLVEAVLRGIPMPPDRARWVLRYLPLTAAMLGVEAP